MIKNEVEMRTCKYHIPTMIITPYNITHLIRFTPSLSSYPSPLPSSHPSPRPSSYPHLAEGHQTLQSALKEPRNHLLFPLRHTNQRPPPPFIVLAVLAVVVIFVQGIRSSPRAPATVTVGGIPEGTTHIGGEGERGRGEGIVIG